MSEGLDKALLIGTALLVIVVGGAAFWYADDHNINPGWVFCTWNSIGLIPIFARKFRGHWKNPFFILFFALWMAAHGGLIVFLMLQHIPYGYWPVLMLIELMIALGLAHSLFRIPYDRTEGASRQNGTSS